MENSLPYRVSSYGDFLRNLEGMTCPPYGHYHYHNRGLVGPPIGGSAPDTPPASPNQQACPGHTGQQMHHLAVPPSPLDTTPPPTACPAMPPPGGACNMPPSPIDQSQHNASIQGGNGGDTSNLTYENFRPLHTSSFMEGQCPPAPQSPGCRAEPPIINLNQSQVNPFSDFSTNNLDSIFGQCGQPQVTQNPTYLINPPFTDPNENMVNPFPGFSGNNLDSLFGTLPNIMQPDAEGFFDAGNVTMSQKPVPRRRGFIEDNNRLNRTMPSLEGDDFPIQTVATEIVWPCVMVNGKGVRAIPLRNKSYTSTERIVLKVVGTDFRIALSGSVQALSVEATILPREVEQVRVAFMPVKLGVARGNLLIIRVQNPRSFRLLSLKGTCKNVCPK